MHSGLLCLPIRLTSCSFCVFAPSPSLFFWFLLFLPLLPPRKGPRNLLLQATHADWKVFYCLGLGGVYYVRCVGEGCWCSVEAYLVLVSMVLQWDVQTKLHSCKTWAILIEWTSGPHKAERERKKKHWQTIREIGVHVHSPGVVFWPRCWTGLNPGNLAPVLLFQPLVTGFLDHLLIGSVCPKHVPLTVSAPLLKLSQR